MSIFCKEVLNINGSLFLVKKALKEQFCKDVDLLKEWYSADIVFKKEELMYFCEAVIDLECETI